MVIRNQLIFQLLRDNVIEIAIDLAEGLIETVTKYNGEISSRYGACRTRYFYKFQQGYPLQARANRFTFPGKDSLSNSVCTLFASHLTASCFIPLFKKILADLLHSYCSREDRFIQAFARLEIFYYSTITVALLSR